MMKDSISNITTAISCFLYKSESKTFKNSEKKKSSDHVHSKSITIENKSKWCSINLAYGETR